MVKMGDDMERPLIQKVESIGSTMNIYAKRAQLEKRDTLSGGGNWVYWTGRTLKHEFPC